MRNRKRINIRCDRATQERIIITFAEESDRCFFGHGICGAYKDSDGPMCRKCILDRAEWEIIDEDQITP